MNFGLKAKDDLKTMISTVPVFREKEAWEDSRYMFTVCVKIYTLLIISLFYRGTKGLNNFFVI